VKVVVDPAASSDVTLGTERWPNFLLIGAAKAGTTALFAAITRHPAVCNLGEKEPRFFSYPDTTPEFAGPGSDKNIKTIIHKKADYLRLFSGCPADCMAGEASTNYLADEIAPQSAGLLIPDARLIAILRHPVERAYSQFLHLRQEGHEQAATFEEAWKDGDRRMAENWRPAFWHRHRGFYAQHLNRWLEHFPREQLLVLFYEDFRDRPNEVLAQIWHHLAIEPITNPVVARENVSSRQPHWAWLHHRMVDQDNPFRRLAQRTLPLWARDAVTKGIGAVNLRPGPRLDPKLRAQLAITYHDDLTELEALTGRDLTHWRT
jgi:hypothetical protein